MPDPTRGMGLHADTWTRGTLCGDSRSHSDVLELLDPHYMGRPLLGLRAGDVHRCRDRTRGSAPEAMGTLTCDSPNSIRDGRRAAGTGSSHAPGSSAPTACRELSIRRARAASVTALHTCRLRIGSTSDSRFSAHAGSASHNAPGSSITTSTSGTLFPLRIRRTVAPALPRTARVPHGSGPERRSTRCNSLRVSSAIQPKGDAGGMGTSATPHRVK